MTTTDPSPGPARHELVLVATILVMVARLVDRPHAGLVAVLLPVAFVAAGWAALRARELPGRPVLSLLVPAVFTGGAGAAIHLVPAGLGLIPALALFAFAIDRVLALELRLLAQATGTTDQDRTRMLAAATLAALVAFTGVATLVPGGLPEPGASGPESGLTEAGIAALALLDALAAFVLGFRVAWIRYGSVRDAARSALTYAIVVAIAAGALRAVDVPRLVGPAALTLVFYLWDAVHATAPARRREPRFLWETALLAMLAVVVVAWNLRLRA